MKLNKITTKSASNKAMNALVIAGGGMLGKGLSSLVPISNQKSVQAIIAVLGLLAATGVKNSTVANLGIGITAGQLIDLISETAGGIVPQTNIAIVDKFLAASFDNDANATLKGITAYYDNPFLTETKELFEQPNNSLQFQ